MANKDNPGLLEQAAPSRCSCGPRFRWLAWGQASCCGFPADGQKKFELASRISLVSTLFTVVLAINYVEKVFGGLHHLQSLQMQLASSMDAVARKPVETPLVAGPNSLPEQSPMKGEQGGSDALAW